MKFNWNHGKHTKRRWFIWDGFQELIDLCENLDGPIANGQWLLDELETVGELELSHRFIELYNSGKKYKNPNNSSLAYFLGITNEAPTDSPAGMKMSQGRISAPDIDLDFEDRYRERAMEYTRQKYGHDRCAQIVTFGEMGAKKAVRDIARIYDYPYEMGDRISKTMPPPVFGVAPTLDKCLESPEFKALYDGDEDVRLIVDKAKNLEGIWREDGIHAAGLVVADRPISDYVPVMQKGKDAPVVTQWEMKRAEKCGLLKIDFLALTNLTIISKCKENILSNKGIDIGDPYELVRENDENVFELMRRGENVGLFQAESSGFRDLMVDVKPTDMNDVAAMLALYRPGPMGSGVHKEYAARKNNRKKVAFLHEKLKDILGDTFGLLLYQDQLLSIVKEVAGRNTFEADEFRSIVGKKIIEKMPAQRDAFVRGCADNGVPRDIAEKLFNDIEHHAAYSFNKAHSVSYAFISYVTAYLKAHYPTEYMAAALSSSYDDVTKSRLYLNEAKRLGIEVRRPSINSSEHDFLIEGNSIVYGFDSVNGLAEASVDWILNSRKENGKTDNIFEFLRKSDPTVLTRKILSHLAMSGALDELLPENMAKPMNRNERIQLLFDEAKQLGVFLVQHPYLDLVDLVADKVSHSIYQLKEGISEPSVRVAGIITEVTKKTTKAGKRMFILTIEDNTDYIEVIVFPREAEKLKEEIPFATGELIVIDGKIKMDGEDESLKVSLIYTGGEKVDYSDISTERPIILRANREISIERLKQISDIIQATHGSSNVMLEMPLSYGGKILLKFEGTVSADTEDILRKLIEVQ